MHFPNPILNFAQIAFRKSLSKFSANSISQISFEFLRKSQFAMSIQSFMQIFVTIRVNCKSHFTNLIRISCKSFVTIRVSCQSDFAFRKCHSKFVRLLASHAFAGFGYYCKRSGRRLLAIAMSLNPNQW